MAESERGREYENSWDKREQKASYALRIEWKAQKARETSRNLEQDLRLQLELEES